MNAVDAVALWLGVVLFLFRISTHFVLSALREKLP